MSAPAPGRILLTWKLVHPADIASVFVLRGPAGRCPTNQPLQASAARIGGVTPRTRQADTTEHDRKRYCYAVYTLDNAGNWASPVTHFARNKGDTTAPAAVTGITGVVGKGGAIKLAWTNPPDAAHDLVVRGSGSTCPTSATDGTPVGTRRLRESQTDTSVPATATYCYGVFAYDRAGNVSTVATTTVEPPPPPSTPAGNPSAPPARQSSSSSSSLPTIVALLGGGALVLAGLAFATLRIVRREWEWHTRTGYGIRDLVSIDVHDYNPLALVIPAVIGVCIAGAVVVLLLSL